MADPSCVSSVAQQHVLDATVELLAVRRGALAELERGTESDDVHLVTGSARLNAWMMGTARGWRHLLSTRPFTSADHLALSLPNNRLCVGRGLEMVSVFDHRGTDAAARTMLAAEGAPYLYSQAPIQMRLVDQREVYLHGPTRNGEESILRLRGRPAVDAARVYWDAVRSRARPCRGKPAEPELTERQRLVLDLLRHDLADERIAARLDLSVRTVRATIAAAMVALDVRSRFSAGYAYALLESEKGSVE
ncbi:regulatory protein, luxR family [Jatrophihabitans endophyticus]|uniref:Regulatory protein, luxR family n=1 Tax=Jatrophihabitans endophyticus TaxID=1206085 RepID=A0A1M5SXV8_9ACTN|nr:helix-turn-helix transcriptional regulator [Jatrophihabitans endophyticus]SHH43367.1 regulatory protein, luxR family [Jatrophihabitans endophyticus]